MIDVNKRTRTRVYGKLIETIVIDIDRKKHEIEIRLDHGRGDFSYSLVHVYRSGEIEAVQGTDLNKLRAEIRKKLEQSYHIKWDNYIVISVGGDVEPDACSPKAEINIGAGIWQIGLRLDGTSCHRESRLLADGSIEESGYARDGGRAELLKNGRYNSETGIIPYIPEAFKKLKAMTVSIGRIRDAIAAMLTGEDSVAIEAVVMRSKDIQELLPAPARGCKPKDI